MQNTRPNHNITLPTKEGKTLSATIKTPVLKVKRLVQALTVKSIALSEECLETFKLTKAVNERLAMMLGSTDETKVRAERNAIVAKIDALNEEQFNIEIEQLKLIVNIPNDGETKRSHDDIDWEEIPEDEIKEAIGFFVNGLKS
jgi:plasmid maintenance system antidote protein VapI